MSSSESSDSDLAEKTKFKDAAVDIGNLFHLPASTMMLSQSTMLPLANSLQKGFDLDTTAEFRRFVATKLYESLIRRMKFKKCSIETASKTTDEADWGFRLFSTSIANARSEDKPIVGTSGKRRRTESSSSSNSDTSETYASVAVDTETIMADKAMLNNYRTKQHRKGKTLEGETKQCSEVTDKSGHPTDKPKEAKNKKQKVTCQISS